MADMRAARRYAKSILDLGIEKRSADKINADMGVIKEALKHKDLMRLVKSPIIKADKKISIFKAIFGESLDKVTMTFLELVTTKGREKVLPQMVQSFEQQYQAFKKVSSVKVTTASPMTEDVMTQIKATLLASNITADSVDIVSTVNPELIGGFIIEIGDKLYDASIAHKINKLKKGFLDNTSVNAV